MSILLCVCYIVLADVRSGGFPIVFFLFYNHFQYFFAVLCTYFCGFFSLIILIMKNIICTLKQTLNFDKRSFPHAAFLFLFSLRMLTVKKNNNGYFVSLNISLAFSSNIAATLLVWLLLDWSSF